VLLIGTNDIGIGADPADVADNLRAILAALERSNPQMPVVVCQVMPSDASMQRPAEKIQRLNGLLADLVKPHPKFLLCDTYHLFANAEGNAKPEEFPDLLHPNAAGYAKWVAALQPMLAGLKLPPAGPR